MTIKRDTAQRRASRWMGSMAAAGMLAAPMAAVAGPLDLYIERTAMAAADLRCGFFDAGLRAALEAGCDVASANKQAVSRDPAGLQALAYQKGRRVFWSASVGGGSPMIETVRAARAAGEVAGFEAVLNGTVNFMLERLGDGAAFAEALADEVLCLPIHPFLAAEQVDRVIEGLLGILEA